MTTLGGGTAISGGGTLDTDGGTPFRPVPAEFNHRMPLIGVNFDSLTGISYVLKLCTKLETPAFRPEMYKKSQNLKMGSHHFTGNTIVKEMNTRRGGS